MTFTNRVAAITTADSVLTMILVRADRNGSSSVLAGVIRPFAVGRVFRLMIPRDVDGIWS